MAHEDEKIQRTREECRADAATALRYKHKAMLDFQQGGKEDAATLSSMFGQDAIAHALLALSAPPTENPTPPTQDGGAALALLVALVAELQNFFPTVGESLMLLHHPDLYRTFESAETYVRTQAAKGEAGR